MPQIRLTALKSGTPIGFMAALGAFRHASSMAELGIVKLGWQAYGGQWCAFLETSHEVKADQLAQLFVQRAKTLAERPEFGWSKAIKSASVDDFRYQSQAALESATAQDSHLADWFQSFATELAQDDGVVESTPFDMTVARQLFLADAEWLTRSLAEPDKKRGDANNDANNLEAFREGLFGPWRYADNQHSLGWDPTRVLMGAFTPKAPTAMNKAGVRAAVWLAMESLPFFPCFYADRGLATSGFVRKKRRQSFRWAVWESPLSLSAVRLLLAQIPGIRESDKEARGLRAIYSSAIYKPNKYLTSFQAAVLEA